MLSPSEYKMKTIQESIDRQEYSDTMSRGFQVADIFINKQYLDRFAAAEIEPGPVELIQNCYAIQVYQISKIVFDAKEDINDKLISVYNSLYNIESSVALIIKSYVTHVDFFIAVRLDHSPQLAGEMILSTLQSNFPGIKIKNLNGNEIEQLLSSLNKGSSDQSLLNGLSTVSLVPALRDKEKKDQFVQGLEKFVYTLQGKEYVGILLATPLSKAEIVQRKHGLEELASFITPHTKISYSYGQNNSIAVNKGISTSFTKSVNESVSNSQGESNTTTHSDSSTRSSGYSFGGGSSGEGSSSSWGWNGSTSSGTSSSYASGTSFTNSISNSVGESNSESLQSGKTETEGSTETVTLNFENKGASDLLNRIEENIQRINQWESYGLWESCAYFFSDEVATSLLASSTYKSLMVGEQSYIEKAHVNIWDGNRKNKKAITDIFEKVKYLVHPKALLPIPKEIATGISSQFVSPTTLIGGNELAILLGFPRKSIAGLAVQEMAEFGRSVVYENKIPKKKISIGNVYHMGIEDRYASVEMDLDLFASHCFITGSSGSGKSYATYNLLGQLLKHNIKMMVIEPAKGEYKTVFGGLKGVNIYTTSTETYRLLRINPFQFPEKIHILSHIEQLLQIFNASWPLYAAMPAILKQAVVAAYVRCGWDLQNSIWIAGVCNHKYPVFEDILDLLPEIINTSDYSADSKGDYKGALLTRVEAMTTGMNGLIFKKSEGIPDEVLFGQNALIDLSEAGSDETIALLMGILIMRLNEYHRSLRKKGVTSSHDSGLKHITVLEEAHNLLKRTSKDQNQEGANMVGKSVEMISNSIKEMRTYGEGFLIIDQSPLAVDSSAIENTATKIVLNTPSQEACKELGSALSLDENQTKELSRLNIGIAAVLQKGWLSPVLMKVGKWDSTVYEKELQYETPGMLKYVRTLLVKEFYIQVVNKSFTIGKLRSIIRRAELDRDRKSELEEILALYQNYRNQTTQLSDKMIGHIFIELCNCEALFSVLPTAGVASALEVNRHLDSDDDDALDKWMALQIDAALKWLCNFETALKNYINPLSKKELYLMVFCMLSLKGESGDEIYTIYGWLYQLIKYMDLPEEEEKEEEDVQKN